LEQKFEITDLKSGNVKVYEALFRQLYKPLCQYANAILHDQDEAEDMTQKAFCKLWEQREKLEIQSSIKSYLYRMVHNLCLNKIKQWQTRAEHHEWIAHNSVSAGNNVEHTIAYKELNNSVDAAIAELPERCRQVFLLSRMQHLSYAEIALEMKISPNTVETQMVKALKTLRIKLKDFLVFVPLFFLTFIN
jgi:RNA polymerase sigma-70 factor (ECF subfamily)